MQSMMNGGQCLPYVSAVMGHVGTPGIHIPYVCVQTTVNSCSMVNTRVSFAIFTNLHPCRFKVHRCKLACRPVHLLSPTVYIIKSPCAYQAIGVGLAMLRSL